MKGSLEKIILTVMSICLIGCSTTRYDKVRAKYKDLVKQEYSLQERIELKIPENVHKEEAILELRKEARELDEEPCSFENYARNAYKAKIRRNLADKLEHELKEEQTKK